MGTVLTALFVPETRGKSIDEIQQFFNKSRKPSKTRRGSNRLNLEADANVESTPLKTVQA
jgi:hypothetical protein